MNIDKQTHSRESLAENMFQTAGKPVTLPTQEFIVGSPVTSPTQPDSKLWGVDGNLVDANSLTSAERELGVGFEVNLNFENVGDQEFFTDVNPAVTQANKIVTELRLKSVGVVGLTPDEQSRLTGYNDFISSVYSMRDAFARQEQQHMEAEALILVNEAEALLNSTSSDMDADVDVVYERVKAIVDKLGPKASNDIRAKLEGLRKYIEAKAIKAEAK